MIDPGSRRSSTPSLLLGAMAALGQPVPDWTDFVETGVFNSNKVFAAYPKISG